MLWFAGLGGMCKMCCGLQGWVECIKCAMVEGLDGMCKMCCGLQG